LTFKIGDAILILMNKKHKKRGPPFKEVKKVRRAFSFDSEVIESLEAAYPEGKRSSFINRAAKETLEREEHK
jgi:hypothetical protein